MHQVCLLGRFGGRGLAAETKQVSFLEIIQLVIITIIAITFVIIQAVARDTDREARLSAQYACMKLAGVPSLPVPLPCPRLPNRPPSLHAPARPPNRSTIARPSARLPAHTHKLGWPHMAGWSRLVAPTLRRAA